METAVVNIMVPQGGRYEETFTFYEDEAKTVPKDLGVKDWSAKIVMRDKAKKFDAVVSTQVDTSAADQGRITVTVPTGVSTRMRPLNHDDDGMEPAYNYVYAVIATDGTDNVWLMRGDLAVIPNPEL